MTPLDEAITMLGAEVAAFQAGTKEQPGADDPRFYVLRAKVVGLSMLKQMRTSGLEMKRADSYYRSCVKAVKGLQLSEDEVQSAAEAVKAAA